jgi:two-component system OmpR family response regulator
MRRAEPAAGRLQAGDLFMDTRAHRVMRGGREIDLTKTEYRVLEVLMRSAGQVVLRRDRIAAGWDAHVDDNSLDVTMSALRSAVDKGFPRRLIRTVRGFGYRLELP